ncbi:uncharacterized protein LOC135127693 isoform X1 [Zophobas morio]|uniref:uncharacterized protein LOC135127693 isoform X1 n=2 Tax=Zophobas morio TaxID=2755281 RepID=UPI00308274E6
MILRSFVCFLFCGSLSSKLPILIRLLDTFDRKKTPLLIDKNGNNVLRSFALWTVLPMVTGFIAIGISFMESAQVVLETIPPELGATNVAVAAYFFGGLSIWQVLPLLMYIYFSIKIKSNFDIINDTIARKGYSGCIFDEDIKYPEDMAEAMEYFRHMHNVCSKSVHVLGTFYGNFMAIDQFCIIVMVIANICTFIKDKGHDSHLLTLTIFNILVVVAVLVISHQIKDSGTKIVDLLHGIVFSRVSEKCRTEIQTFMLQISVLPPEVSAAGFFIIDKRQIPSVLSSIATYLVVSIQFLDEAKLEEMVARNCTPNSLL